MIRSKKEIEAEKKAFKQMTMTEKIDHILAYYKLPVFTVIIALIVLTSTIVTNATKKKPYLYVAYANFTCGETLDEQLTKGYLESIGIDTKKYDIYVYRNLYITDDPSDVDHQYSYASKIKVMGAISARQLDLMFMNKEAYDLMSSSGLLLNLSTTEDNPSFATLSPYIMSNDVILSDNAVDLELGNAEEYVAETESQKNGIDISSSDTFTAAGIDNDLYIGIIANSRHVEECMQYIACLLGNER